MIIVAATHNQDKVKEFSRVLSPLGFEVKTADECGFHDKIDENGTTFMENAFIKASAVCKALGVPVVADDSGISVDALDGRPGIYSARYGGEGVSDSEKNRMLLDELKEIPDEKRTAYYTCAICCLFPDGRKIESVGYVYGKIGYRPQGNEGFGYDPIFYINGKSFGNHTPQEKDAISHRGKALREFADKLKNMEK